MNKAVLATMASLLCCGSALAQSSAADYPSRPVVIIIPSPAGATSDRDARIWTKKLTESLGKPFVLDFKSGAGTTIGTNFVAKAVPDGHTLLNITSAFTITAVTYKNLPYDPVRDFTPVALLLRRPTMLTVHPSLPVRSLDEYIAYARAHPGELNFGSSGAASNSHIIGAWLQSATNTKVTFIHYRGAAPMQLDLLAGRVNVAAMSITVGLPYIKAGKVRPIAILSPERSPLLPGMKTVAEQGTPDFDYSAWTGMLAPSGVPAAIINKLGAEFVKVSRSPDVIERFADDGTVLMNSTPVETRQYITAEINRWRRLVKEYDIRAEEE